MENNNSNARQESGPTSWYDAELVKLVPRSPSQERALSCLIFVHTVLNKLPDANEVKKAADPRQM
jgi:hypothetical protein